MSISANIKTAIKNYAPWNAPDPRPTLKDHLSELDQLDAMIQQGQLMKLLTDSLSYKQWEKMIKTRFEEKDNALRHADNYDKVRALQSELKELEYLLGFAYDLQEQGFKAEDQKRELYKRIGIGEEETDTDNGEMNENG